MRVLVTGGAGFIGSHLVHELVKQGYTVRVLDNLSSGKTANLAALHGQIELVIGDLCDTATIRSSVEGMERVIHLAALVSVVQSVEQPQLTHDVNATGTLGLLEAARAAGVGRVVLASSCAVYGDPQQVPTSEETPPHPLSPYALTKRTTEEYAQLYSELYGLECVALRFFNVYGPRQDPASPYAAVIPRFVAALAAGNQPTIFGDGHQSRDFVYVGDIVRALWTAATAPGIAGAVFNVGRGEAWSLLDLVEMIGEQMRQPVAPIFVPGRAGEIRHSCANVELFARRAGFRAQVDLGTDISAVVASLARVHP